MELKDVILSTLAEMEENEATKKVLNSSIKPKVMQKNESETREMKITPILKSTENISSQEDKILNSDEILFLNSFKERLLVLFEGFQAPNNVEIESKIDLTLNFLEYALAKIDDRIQKLEKGNRQ